MTGHPTLGLVCCAAGGIEDVGTQLVEPLLEAGWRVAITTTPSAAEWLRNSGQDLHLETLTGYAVRSAPRLPTEASPHPPVDCYAVVPATANTVAKLALGIADNQALTSVCEAIGGRAVPVLVFPRVNAAHARQPAWESHLGLLRSAGVQLIYGEDVWPLQEPRSAPERSIPWAIIREGIRATVQSA